MDFEAVEMAVRAAMHQAGASALSQLLEFDVPPPNERQRLCPCGGSAKYVGLRSKPVLTAVGEAQCLRPYYLCERCHHGQFPVDLDLDIEDTELSPGVRRMMAAVGHEAAFDRGREQLKLLAGLTVNTKAVERTAEAIGEEGPGNGCVVPRNFGAGSPGELLLRSQSIVSKTAIGEKNLWVARIRCRSVSTNAIGKNLNWPTF